MVLPDTSVWVPYFRGARDTGADHLADLIEAGEVATCGPVMAELLAGCHEEQRDLLINTVGVLPWAELIPAAWHEIGTVAHRLRKAGQTLPLTDLAIAVAANRAGHALWSFDTDFERISQELDGLELYEPR